jgi:lipopolysaccharide/colanic/teichoic acid biosynthesis glycosyltransferase
VALRDIGRFLDALATESLNRLAAALLLVVLSPLVAVLAILIRLDSPGPVFFRCRRIGLRGREFGMLKFRKMHASASGIALTAPDDDRFTRLGRTLAKSKLDEVPQLWNVLRGHMSLVGPRPEDAAFVELRAQAYQAICCVKPGITGLSQLAFARESQILDPEDRVADYVERLLPQKIRLDQFYAERRSIGMDLRILFWTIVAVVLRREVAVHRESGCLNVRRRPAPAPVFAAAPVFEAVER